MSTLQRKLADKLQGVKWADKYFYCLCPFHDDGRASMIVGEERFTCLAGRCGKTGKLEYLEQQLSGISFLKPPKQKYILLPKWKNWEKRYGGIDKIASVAHQNVLQGGDGYFRRRQIDQFIKPGMFGLLDGWAMFPVLNKDREVIDIVVRAIRQAGMKYVIRPYSENELRPLYVPNWQRVIQSDYVYVVFGIITAWALEAIEQPVVTGITGKSIKPELLDQFQKPIIVIPDWNEEKDAYHLANQLGWRGQVKRILWNDCSEDLDDLWKSVPEYQFRQMVQGKWS